MTYNSPTSLRLPGVIAAGKVPKLLNFGCAWGGVSGDAADAIRNRLGSLPCNRFASQTVKNESNSTSYAIGEKGCPVFRSAPDVPMITNALFIQVISNVRLLHVLAVRYHNPVRSGFGWNPALRGY